MLRSKVNKSILNSTLIIRAFNQSAEYTYSSKKKISKWNEVKIKGDKQLF